MRTLDLWKPILLLLWMILQVQCIQNQFSSKELIIFDHIQVISHQVIAFWKLIVTPEGCPVFRDARTVYVEQDFRNDGIVHQTISSEGSTIREPANLIIRCKNSIENKGMLIFNGLKAKVASRVRLGPARYFTNAGCMWFKISGQARKPVPKEQEPLPTFLVQLMLSSVLDRVGADPDIRVLADERFVNVGWIKFSGTKEYKALVVLETLDHVSVSKIQNRGIIIFEHVFLEILQKIKRAGCIVVTDGALLILSYPDKISSKQILYMDSVEELSIIVVVIKKGRKSFNLTVAGFSRNCMIQFSHKMQISSISPQGHIHFVSIESPDLGTILIPHIEEHHYKFDGYRFESMRSRPRRVIKQCWYNPRPVLEEIEDMRPLIEFNESDEANPEDIAGGR